MTAMREAIAGTLSDIDGECLPLDYYAEDVTKIITAIRAAGPTEGMLLKAAEEIEQGVKDYACDDMDGGGFVTVEQAKQIARAALDAAFAEMAGEK